MISQLKHIEDAQKNCFISLQPNYVSTSNKRIITILHKKFDYLDLCILYLFDCKFGSFPYSSR